MKRILIAYGTTEGHTRKIAERVAEWVRDDGWHADVVDTAVIPPILDVAAYDAVILAGSLHQGKHQASLTHFVRENAQTLSRKPSALLSCSLTATIEDDKHFADAQRCIDGFLNETGWTPTDITPVAGALLYTKYDWLKRMLMRSISKKEGGDIDTSRDYEYTNWPKLEEFVHSFVRKHTPVGV